jgi:hypothetical protein
MGLCREVAGETVFFHERLRKVQTSSRVPNRKSYPLRSVPSLLRARPLDRQCTLDLPCSMNNPV